MTFIPHKNGTKTNRRTLLIGLGVLGGLTGLGLYPFSTRHTHKPLTEDAPTYPVRVASLANEENQLLTLAQEKGFFQHYGIETTAITNIKNKNEIFHALQENKCDLAVLSILDWLPQFLSTDSVMEKLLIGLNGNDFRLIVTRKQKIERLMDLNGLAIGIQTHSEKEKLFFSILLRRKGVNPDLNIKWTEMEKEELLPALLSNQIQALIGSDPFIWQLLNHNDKKLFELAGSQTGSWSSRINQVLGVSNKFLQDNPTLLRPIIHAIHDTTSWQKNHTQEASQILTTQWNKMDPKDILTMFKNENQNLTVTDNRLWEQVAQYIDEFKLLNQIPNTLKSSHLAKQFCITAT